MEIELKNLTKEFINLFGDLENFDLSKISDENCEKYLKLINNDLDTDYLQKIWQFYMADREGKKQDFSPKSLGVLTAELTRSENETCENIKYILDVIKNKNTVPGFSITTMPGAENLTPGIYVGVEEEEKYTRSYFDIAKDLERIMNQKNMSKLTINEVWARETNMIELSEKMKRSNELVDEINDIFSKVLKLDIKLPKGSFLTVTRAKELKLEQKSREEIKTNFLFALEQWRTIIHFLNLEENRLLTELKEKLLPDLMSGKIDLEGIDI